MWDFTLLAPSFWCISSLGHPSPPAHPVHTHTAGEEHKTHRAACRTTGWELPCSPSSSLGLPFILSTLHASAGGSPKVLQQMAAWEGLLARKSTQRGKGLAVLFQSPLWEAQKTKEQVADSAKNQRAPYRCGDPQSHSQAASSTAHVSPPQLCLHPTTSVALSPATCPGSPAALLWAQQLNLIRDQQKTLPYCSPPPDQCRADQGCSYAARPGLVLTQDNPAYKAAATAWSSARKK